MAKKTVTTTIPSFDDIKKAIVLGLFSNDYLLEKLVLKGGNALSLVYSISTRASLDIDLSIPDAFDNFESVSDQIKFGLDRSFEQLSLVLFDFSVSEGHMLAIVATKWLLIATLFDTLHPDGDAVDIPVKDLDTVAAAI